jgi:hypothetical protein
MKEQILTVLHAFVSGELSIEEAADQIEGELGVIETLDRYAMSALQTVSDELEPDAMAEQAFAIARACMYERARVIHELSGGTEGHEDDDAPNASH